MLGRVRNSFHREHISADASYDRQADPRLIGKIESCYLELLGELHPQAVRGINPQEVKEPAATPIHEYSWNVGIVGTEMTWYDNLVDDDALVVQLLFQTSRSRYAVHEVAANLMQVPPYQKTTAEAILDWIDLCKPVMETAGKALEATGAGAPGKVLSAVAGMKLNAVPVDKFRWYVKTFSLGEEAGIEWHIPKAMLIYTGNRICGSLGVTLLDCEEAPTPTDHPDELALEMKAFLRLKSGFRDLLVGTPGTSNELFLNAAQGAPTLRLRPLQ